MLRIQDLFRCERDTARCLRAASQGGELDNNDVKVSNVTSFMGFKFEVECVHSYRALHFASLSHTLEAISGLSVLPKDHQPCDGWTLYIVNHSRPCLLISVG